MENEQNIFILDEDYKVSVTLLNDHHIRHLPFFVARVLSGFLRHGENLKGYQLGGKKQTAYIQYFRVTFGNYSKVLGYLDLLLKEFKHRFDKEHLTVSIFKDFKSIGEEELRRTSWFAENAEETEIPLHMEPRYHVMKKSAFGSLSMRHVRSIKTFIKYYKEVHEDGVYTKRKKPEWLQNDKNKKPRIQDAVREVGRL